MNSARPVIFGEVLYDCFADNATLGGAPFNVAWHLCGFGLNPLLISRIGNDDLGAKALEAMVRWGMDVSGLQRDSKRPTGTVRITLHGGQPHYDILPNQAYDYVSRHAAGALLQHDHCALLYHGTLALRNKVSQEALHALRTQSRAPVFVDINLRAPWWDLEKVTQLVRGAACVKLNESELQILAGGSGDLHNMALDLRRKLAIDALVVTLGERGAFTLTYNDHYAVTAPAVGPLVDAVGAGDAFSAVVILGLLRSWSWADTLSRAAHFAAQVTQHRGAIQEDRGRYQKSWQSVKQRNSNILT